MEESFSMSDDSDNDADYESLDDESDVDNDDSNIKCGNNAITDYTCPVPEEFSPKVNIENENSQDQKPDVKTVSNLPVEPVQSKSSEIVAIDNSIETKINHIPEVTRVPLRRERKNQQRNEAISKKNLIEKDVLDSKDVDKTETEAQASSWNIGTWGSSIFNTAASSVSLLTNQVSQGIGTVIETVENSLISPLSEEKADSRQVSVEKDLIPEPENVPEEKLAFPDEKESKPRSSFFSEVASWTKAFENTGAKVIVGGLDTLELIGKKSMDIIMQGDPGLRRKRTALSRGYQTLSEVLREAKAKDDVQKTNEPSESVFFSHSFEEHGGMAHLEALELLSQQCKGDMEAFMERYAEESDVKQTTAVMREIFDSVPSMDSTPDNQKDHNFVKEFLESIQGLNVTLNVKNFTEFQQKVCNSLSHCLQELESGNAKDAEEIYHDSIKTLAEFTAKSVELFHKIAEVLLVQSREEQDPLSYANNITRLTTVLCLEICILSSQYCLCLDNITKFHEYPDKVVPKMTTIYFEVS